MTDTARELRDTSDSLLVDLDLLATLEQEKRGLEAEDSRLVEVSAEIASVAQRVLERTQRQQTLTEVAHDLAEAGSREAPDRPIDAMYPRPIHVVLDEWRDVERQVAGVARGSPEAIEMALRIERLRDEYRRAHELARAKVDGRTE